MSMTTLEDGAVFANRYRIVRCIARGGMGAVYEVVHIGTNRRRALKVMHSHILHSDELRVRFHREAKVAAEVESDHIVDVFDAGIDEATEMPFLCMELLRGEELSRRLRRLGRVPPDELAQHLHQTALALDQMHKVGIIHRDLKPENLFITESQNGPTRIKVLDFGIAKVIADGVSGGPTTLSVGTPLYMSPEQFRPKGKLTGASDVYALGMIAYTCLVGGPYWEDEARKGNIFSFGNIVARGPIDPASARAKKRGVTLPSGFDEWFVTVTNVAPERRFSPATAATRALAELLGSAAAWPRAQSAPVLQPPSEPSLPPLDVSTSIPISITGIESITGIDSITGIEPITGVRDSAPTTDAITARTGEELTKLGPAPDRQTTPAPLPTDDRETDYRSGSIADAVTIVPVRAPAPSYPTVAAPPSEPSYPAAASAEPPQSARRPPLPSYPTVTAVAVPDDPTTQDAAKVAGMLEDDEGQTLVYKPAADPNADAKAALLRKIEAHREARRAAAAAEAQAAAPPNDASPSPAAPPGGMPAPPVPARTRSPAPGPVPAPPKSWKGLVKTEVMTAPSESELASPEQNATLAIPISAPAPRAPALAARFDDGTPAAPDKFEDAATGRMTTSSTSNPKPSTAAPAYAPAPFASSNAWGSGSPSASSAPNPSSNAWGSGSPSASSAPNPSSKAWGSGSPSASSASNPRPPPPPPAPEPPHDPRLTPLGALTPSGAVLPASPPDPRPFDPLTGSSSLTDEELALHSRRPRWRIIAAIGGGAAIGVILALIAAGSPDDPPEVELPSPATVPTPSATITTTTTTTTEAPPAPSASTSASAASSASAAPTTSSSTSAQPTHKTRPRFPGPKGTGRPKYTQE